VGMITNVHIFGGPRPQNLGGQDLKIWHNFAPVGGLAKQMCELWCTNERVMGVDVDLP